MASPLVQALLGQAAGVRKETRIAKAAKPSPPPTAKILAAVLPAAPVKIKPPDHAKRLKEDMQYTKRRATERWVNGEINTAQHRKIHERADTVMREPAKFVKPRRGRK